MKVPILRLRPDVSLPSPATPGAAGFDLAAGEDITIGPGQIALVPTGLVMALPPGHFLGIFARSSTPLKRGLVVANGVGVIDSDYCGPGDEIKIQLLNVTAEAVHVRRGDRLAQGILIPFVRVEWDERQAMDAPTRGGFGSSG